MFGDPVKNQKKLAKVKLSELGEWKTGGTPLRSKSEYYNGNIPWLSSGELNNKYCFKSNEMITESAIIESAAKIIEVGSLLLGMYDTAALKSTINMIECSCNQAIAYSKLNENLVNTVYVYYCIQIGKEFYKSQQRGVRQKNLNLSMVKGLEILMPPLEFQNQFADFVKQVDKLKFEMERISNLDRKIKNTEGKVKKLLFNMNIM
ncbi:restriction endonuclease subunit S [Clostridium perfringens]|uniref:restriction endonuclease subunit S n=1 Tax=Clostridium perfringens TaxID=1502 RepID=UPI00311A9554